MSDEPKWYPKYPAKSPQVKVSETPRTEQENQWRMEGRREALSILMREDAETFAEDYQVSHPIADTGDYTIGWDEEKLKAMMGVDSLSAMVEDKEADYWAMMSKKDEADLRLATTQRELEAAKGAAMCFADDGVTRITWEALAEQKAQEAAAVRRQREEMYQQVASLTSQLEQERAANSADRRKVSELIERLDGVTASRDRARNGENEAMNNAIALTAERDKAMRELREAREELARIKDLFKA